MDCDIGQAAQPVSQFVPIPHQENRPAAAAFIALQDPWEGKGWFLVIVVAQLKVVYRFIAAGFRVGGVEFSKKTNVGNLSLKAEPIRVIGKEVGTTGTAKPVLVGFDTLGNDNRVCRGDGLGLCVRKKAL
jgi:hypothetical protein